MKLKLPKGTNLSEEYLKYKCTIGFKKKQIKKKSNKSDYIKRLKHELDVIIKLEFVDYFLIVADYVNWAKNGGIRVGAGRGSGSGSLVGYLLGITNIDPLKYGLLFERFLNADRVSPPDYDIDFQDNRRSEVFDYITKKYGEANVASISTHDTLKPKAAIKDIARSLRIGGDKSDTFKLSNKITKEIGDDPDITIEKALEESQQLAAYCKEFPDLFEHAKNVEGLIRQSGTHAAGIIISKEPLVNEIPMKVHKRKKDGAIIITTEYDGTTLEELGYLKADLLGLRTLTIIDDTLKNIKRIYNEPLKRILFDDKKTYEMLNNGFTMNVFQLESHGMRSFLQQVVVEDIEDIAVVLALHRPGPLETFAHEYADRKHGRKAVPTRHYALDQILSSTYGIMVYQEQIIQIVNKVAGFSLEQADVIRRAIGKKKKKEMIANKQRFIDGCVVNGLSESLASDLWTDIEKFAKYSFNKSHAVAYATISYQTAYLKANYPACFMAAVLSHEKISDSISVYMRECAQMRIKILPPDINISGRGFQVKDKKSLVWNLTSFKGVGNAAIEEILKNRPFVCFEQVAALDARKINKTALTVLNGVGAFSNLKTKDGEKIKRSQVEACTVDIRKQIASKRKKKIPILDEPWYEYPEMDEWTSKVIMLKEIQAINYPYLTCNPYEIFKKEIPEHYDAIEDIHQDIGKYPPGKRVLIIGLIEKKIREMTISTGRSKGKQAGMFIVSDQTDSMEMVIWPQQYEKIREKLNRPRFCALDCTISQRRMAGNFKQLVYNRVKKAYF